MHKLRVPLSSIPQEGLVIDVVVSENDLRPPDAKKLGLGLVSVAGTLEEVKGECFFRGTVSGAYHRECDRCLAPTEQPFSASAFWVFERGMARSDGRAEGLEDEEVSIEAGDGPCVLFFEGDELDLAPMAWEEAVLMAPLKYLCREDCAGLCPECGKDLNQGPCECSKKEAGEKLGNPGLSGLADLFPDLKARGKED